MTAPRLRVAIIGGGIAGLSSANLLGSVDSMQITLYEASNRLGGVLQTEHHGGFVCETGANGFLSRKPGDAADLADTLGVATSPAASAAKHRWIYRDQTLFPLPTSPMGFITTKMISWSGKLRTILEPLQPRKDQGQDETIYSFASRRLGQEFTDAIVAPFVTGTFAGEPDEISVRAALPTLVTLEQHGSLIAGIICQKWKKRKEPQSTKKRGSIRLSAPVAGMGELVKQLESNVAQGCHIKRNTKIREINEVEQGLALVSDQATEVFDTVVLAAGAQTAADLVANTSPELALLLRPIESVPMVVVHLGLPRNQVQHPLDGFGFLVARGEQPRMLGCVFESSLWPQRAPDNAVLLRCMYGGSRNPAVIDQDDNAMVALATRDLSQIIGPVGTPSFTRVTRWSHAIPQYRLGHAERIKRAEEIAEPLGIVLGGNACHGVSVNDCVLDAHRVREVLIKHLAQLATAICFLIYVSLTSCMGGTAPSPTNPPVDAQTHSPTKNTQKLDAGETTASGHVTIKVTWPNLPINLRKPRRIKGCDTLLTPPVQVHTLGGIQNAVVILEPLAKRNFPASATHDVMVTLRECMLEPTIAVVKTGDYLRISTMISAPSEINIETVGKPNTRFAHISLGLIGQQHKLHLPHPATFRLQSNLAGEIQSHVIATSSPYFGVTNEKGEIQFQAIEPGVYSATVFHTSLPGKHALPSTIASVRIEPTQYLKTTIALGN